MSALPFGGEAGLEAFRDEVLQERAAKFYKIHEVNGYEPRIMSYHGKMLERFENADADDSGLLDRAELEKLLQEDSVLGCNDVKVLLSRMDTSKDGKISKAEFMSQLVLGVARRQFYPRFKNVDSDKNGIVTTEQVLEVMKSEGYTAEQVEEYFEEDKKLVKGGKLSYHSFVNGFFNILRNSAPADHIALARAFYEEHGIRGFQSRVLKFHGSMLAKFDASDVDGNGTLDRYEITMLLSSDRYLGISDIEKLLEKLDQNKDGAISKGEFMGQLTLGVARKALYPLFQSVSDDSKIPLDAAVKVMTDEGYDEVVIRKFIDDTPAVKDGDNVDYYDFVNSYFNLAK